MTSSISNSEVIIGGSDFLDDDVCRSFGYKQDIEVAHLQVIRVEKSLDGVAVGAVTAAFAAGVLLGTAAQHHIASHRHTFTLNANVVLVDIARRAIDHTFPVSVKESFTSRHAIKLALVMPSRVWYPIIIYSFKGFVVKFRALLTSKILLFS